MIAHLFFVEVYCIWKNCYPQFSVSNIKFSTIFSDSFNSNILQI